MMITFDEFYKEQRSRISEKLRIYEEQLVKNTPESLQYLSKQFVDINKSEKAKTIRGTLISLGYRLMCKDNDISRSIDLAAAYELFETAILVQDDVFDKGDTRRGIPTIHARNSEDYNKKPNASSHKEDITSISNALAICMGDLLFFFINQCIAKSYSTEKCFQRLFDEYNRIVINTVYGEILDVKLPLEERLQQRQGLESQVNKIEEMKTAWYTICPLRLGMILGGANDEQLEQITQFSIPLGVAFQIQDDWLNLFGNPEAGKPLASDVTEFKVTLFYTYMMKNNEYKNEFLKYYGGTLDADGLERFQNILEKSGCKIYVEQCMKEKFKESRTKLEALTFLTPENMNLLRGFVDYLDTRKY
jgi:geranylgeranyl diphosphate synthase type I